MNGHTNITNIKQWLTDTTAIKAHNND